MACSQAVPANDWMLEQASPCRVLSIPHQMPTKPFVKPVLLFDHLVQRISEKLSLMELLERKYNVSGGLGYAPWSFVGTAGSWEVCHSSAHHTEALVPREV